MIPVYVLGALYIVVDTIIGRPAARHRRPLRDRLRSLRGGGRR